MNIDHNNNNNETTTLSDDASNPFANLMELHETYNQPYRLMPIESVNIPSLALELLDPSCTKAQVVIKMARLIHHKHQDDLFKMLMHPPPPDPASNLVQVLPPEILCLIMKHVAFSLRKRVPSNVPWARLTKHPARLKALHGIGLVCKDFYYALWDPSVLRPVYRHYLGYPSLKAHFNRYEIVKRSTDAAAGYSNIAFDMLAGNGKPFTSHMLTLFDMETTAPYLWSLVTSADTSAIVKARCWQRLYRQQWSWMNLIGFGLCRNNSLDTIQKTVNLLEWGLRHKAVNAVRYRAHFGAAHQKVHVRPIICTGCAEPLWVQKSKCHPNWLKSRTYRTQVDVTLTPCGVLCKHCVAHELKNCWLTDLEAPVPPCVFVSADFSCMVSVLRRDYLPLVASGVIYDLFLSKIPMPMRLRRDKTISPEEKDTVTKPPAKKRQKTTAL